MQVHVLYLDKPCPGYWSQCPTLNTIIKQSVQVNDTTCTSSLQHSTTGNHCDERFWEQSAVQVLIQLSAFTVRGLLQHVQ